MSELNAFRDLLLLEEFRNCVPEKIRVYFDEQKVTTLKDAAVAANEFALTYKNVFASPRDVLSVLGPVQHKHLSAQPRQPPSVPKCERECFYCHKLGHVNAEDRSFSIILVSTYQFLITVQSMQNRYK